MPDKKVWPCHGVDAQGPTIDGETFPNRLGLFRNFVYLLLFTTVSVGIRNPGYEYSFSSLAPFVPDPGLALV